MTTDLDGSWSTASKALVLVPGRRPCGCRKTSPARPILFSLLQMHAQSILAAFSALRRL
jgi:hypothetical protein